MTRREHIAVLLRSFSAAAVTGTWAAACNRASASLPEMTIYKTPTCGCCKAWVEHVREAGFATIVVDLDDLAPTKQKLGVPQDLASCHTAIVENYIVEGHVPADVIADFLSARRTDLRGLAVPGMPAGSPGMEVPGQKQPYEVIGFAPSGTREVFARR